MNYEYAEHHPVLKLTHLEAIKASLRAKVGEEEEGEAQEGKTWQPT